MKARYWPCVSVNRGGVSCISGRLVVLYEEEAGMHVRYRVELEDGEGRQLGALVAGGPRGVRTVKRAQILLAAAAGRLDDEIAGTLQVGTSTVYRTKRRFVEESLERALAEEPRPGAEGKLGGPGGGA